MAVIDKLFHTMVERNASDLHLTVGNPPLLRMRGDLSPMADWVLTDNMLRSLLYETMSEEQWKLASENKDYDYAYEVPGLSRFRANVFFNLKGIAAVFRTIPVKIKTIEDLGLPEAVHKLCRLNKGLVLVTGPTGSGKSTTLAAVINEINQERDANILTIEDPIEFVHQSKRCKITQREVHRDTHSFKAALRSCMRQDPDIILVGEMRDYETISLALTAAETGTLVFGTLHTNSSSKTIDRIINVYPAEERDKARGLLASTIKGILSQQLLPTKDGQGRLAAVEILLHHASLPALIRSGKTSGLASLIETNGHEGMRTMDACLMDYYSKGLISAEQAYLKSSDKKKFMPAMEKERKENPYGF